MSQVKTISFVIVATFLILLGISLGLSRSPVIESKETEYVKTVYGNNNSDIKLEFFVSNTVCGYCDDAKQRIDNDIMPIYGEFLLVEQYPVGYTDDLKNNYDLWASYGLPSVPGLAIINTTHPDLANYTTVLIWSDILDIENYTFEKAVEYHLEGNYSKDLDLTRDQNVVHTFLGDINISDLSLPVLTIIIGAIDSINPCSFFILLFLLSILLYTRSRKRMILIGGIFIFFSGFIYFLIMVFLLQAFTLTGEQIIISLMAGIIALIFGILNIKDFFLFKKGPSASIPDSQKPKLYKQMRRIVKITSIPSLIIATIVLAISANTVELICSIILPLEYTAVLTSSNIAMSESYIYLFLYNVMYVLPLIIISIIVIKTLGHKKLNEFQGKMLKLFSGIFIFAIGEVLLINSAVLSDLIVVVLIPLFTLVVTVVIYLISKFFEKPSQTSA